MTYLEFEDTVLDSAFGLRSFSVRHTITDHPLLTPDALAALADRLPPGWVRRERGTLDYEERAYVDTGIGDPSETIRTIGRNKTRVSLREIQQDPVYAPFIRACHEELRPRIGTREGGVCGWSGYVFVSSPGSTTPMHLDPEHSFLLQVRGTKRVYVAGNCDPARLSREVDRYIDSKPCDFDSLKAGSQELLLRPGDGVYFPSFVPHWVATEEDDEHSVSFSLPFYTRFSTRADYVHRFNSRLRRRGLSPRPPGVSDSADQIKTAGMRIWSGFRKSDKLPLPAAS